MIESPEAYTPGVVFVIGEGDFPICRPVGAGHARGVGDAAPYG